MYTRFGGGFASGPRGSGPRFREVRRTGRSPHAPPRDLMISVSYSRRVQRVSTCRKCNSKYYEVHPVYNETWRRAPLLHRTGLRVAPWSRTHGVDTNSMGPLQK